MGNFIRKTIEGHIRGESAGGPLAAVLGPLSALYGAGVSARLGLYRAGLFRPKALPCPVISVGNITAGGSGKTPVTMFIADYLTKRGVRVVILSRGYGGSVRGAAVAGNGGEARLSPAEAGDEPALMARRLAGVPVVIGADRYEAGRLAVKEFSPDVVVLDDGFQHMGLARDLNILLVDGSRPLAGARLLPAGPLREPLTALSRADMVLVKGGRLGSGDRELIAGYGLMTGGFVYRVEGLRDLATGGTLTVKSYGKDPVLAVSAIADPASFLRTLSGIGMKVAHAMDFPDHHPYDAGDVRAMGERMRETGAAGIVTTEKDGVKLQGPLKGAGVRAHALVIEVEIKEMGPFRAAMAPFVRGAKGAKVAKSEGGPKGAKRSRTRGAGKRAGKGGAKGAGP